MEGPTLGWLIGVLVTIAVPIVVIFFVLWIIRRDTIRRQGAVRSPEYWNERPEGKRYPTGWDQRREREAEPDSDRDGEGGPPPGEDGKPPPEGGDGRPPVDGGPHDR